MTAQGLVLSPQGFLLCLSMSLKEGVGSVMFAAEIIMFLIK